MSRQWRLAPCWYPEANANRSPERDPANKKTAICEAGPAAWQSVPARRARKQPIAKDKATARIAGEFDVNAIEVMRAADAVDR